MNAEELQKEISWTKWKLRQLEFGTPHYKDMQRHLKNCIKEIKKIKYKEK